MFNSKFNTILTVLLIVAMIAIVAIIGYLGFSMYNKYYINANAEEVVNSFEQSTGVGNTIAKPDENTIEGTGTDVELSVGGTTHSNGNSHSGSSIKYNNYNVIGTISIPKIKIEYPILEKVTSKSLKVAVAYLSGAGVNQVGNTVIQGHNYKNGLFFSNLYKLSNGDKIYMTDQSGTKITYEVYKNFEAQDTDTSFFVRDTAGKREITLSTCTDNVATRTIILAREVQ